MLGYIVLVLSAVASAIGIVAQTVAARRAEYRAGIDPGLLVRLATDRVYLLGFSGQVAGFLLAFVARATLPLYLVQAGSSSAVGLAALLGLVVLGWRVSRAEILMLLVLAAGLLFLVGAAQPSVAAQMPTAVGVTLLGVLLVAGALAVPAARLTGARGAVAMGILAGVAFAVLALASRPLAAGPLLELPLQPLAWLMVAAALLGQSMLAGALQRGSTTATAASMDATTVTIASVVGLVALGDQIAPGKAAWVAIGLLLVVTAVIGMAVVGHPAQATTPGQPARRHAVPAAGQAAPSTDVLSGRGVQAEGPA
jgi:drug/metabolite transporter (DMT)-like permease